MTTHAASGRIAASVQTRMEADTAPEESVDLLKQNSSGHGTVAASEPRAPDGVVLREMTLDDVLTVGVLERRLKLLDGWPQQMFVDELSQTHTRRYLVAEAASLIVGYAGLMCVGSVADLQTIAVDPAFEGRGIGSALLSELIGEAMRRDAQDVLLEVRANNPRAQQLYLRFGFQQIHVRHRYYRDGVNALIMGLKLTPNRTTPAETDVA